MQLINKDSDNKTIEVTVSDVLEFQDQAQIGMCLECGHKQYGVEPDGDLYECECCDHRAVFGHAKLLEMGMFIVID